MSVSPQPNPEAVDELLKTVERFVADERLRGQGLDTKTSTLAGFSGTILALTATLGGQLFQSDLGHAEILFRALFIASVVALALAAGLAVGGVLRPQPRLAVDIEDIEAFARFPMLAAARLDVQGQMLVTAIRALEAERVTNDRKALVTRYAALALVAGFVLVALLAVTLGATVN